MRLEPSKIAAWLLLALAAAAVFLLLTEHRAHAIGALSWLLIPLCLVLLYAAGSQAEPRCRSDTDRSSS